MNVLARCAGKDYTHNMSDKPSSPRALVVGAGIAGMQSALDIAGAGY